jgi:hypothetical protein
MTRIARSASFTGGQPSANHLETISATYLLRVIVCPARRESTAETTSKGMTTPTWRLLEAILPTRESDSDSRGLAKKSSPSWISWIARIATAPLSEIGSGRPNPAAGAVLPPMKKPKSKSAAPARNHQVKPVYIVSSCTGIHSTIVAHAAVKKLHKQLETLVEGTSQNVLPGRVLGLLRAAESSLREVGALVVREGDGDYAEEAAK